MQPYVFPYIGYIQLVAAVDKFVFYDDVSFIKQGWINRNNILLGGKAHLFTVPLEKASSFNLIKDTKLNQKFYPTWSKKFIMTLEQNYKKAPHYNAVMPMVKEVFFAENETISELAIQSVISTINYLGLKTEIVKSSTIYNNTHLNGQDRVLDICRKEHAKHYINPIGGQVLYSKDTFLEQNLKLNFIKSIPLSYEQNESNDFVPFLSIIDTLMFNSPEQISKMLKIIDLV